MNKRKMFSGGGLFILLIPIGLFFALWLFDIGFRYYNQTKLDKDTEEILKDVLSREGFTTLDEYKQLAIMDFKDRGYDVSELSFIAMDSEYLEENEEAYLMVNYKRFLNMIGTVTFNLLKSDTDIVRSSYKGYFNEYREVIVEKYIEDEEEDLIIDE